MAEAAGADVLLAWPESTLDELATVCGSSPALSRYLVALGPRWPEAARAYAESDPTREELAARIDLPERAETEELHRALRRLAAEEMYRIGARDLLGLAVLGETLGALTRLAEVTVSVAVAHLRRRQAARSGDAVDEEGRPVGFVVLGLGKLGGGELNYSSDIDLVYLYEHDRVGKGSPAAREFFTTLAASVTKAIGEPTADGHVFRVDLRLRPEGYNGPMVNSVENALQYYEGWGDTWERVALAKARPVAGDLAVGESFIEQIQPFVFRRHLDYQAVEDLRSMKDRIDAELAMLKPGTRNVKIGRGGIRELEFVVQTLQLIHGGHQPELRAQGTMAGLARLEAGGLIAGEEASTLREAYAFLRNVEHAVQIEEKRQTQTLPPDRQGIRWLARRLGYGRGERGAPADCEEVEAFERDWSRYTTAVYQAFVRFLELRPGEEERPRSSDVRGLALLGHLADGRLDEAATLLEELGFPDGRHAARNLVRIYGGPSQGPASPQRRRAVEALTPSLVRAVASSSDPETALDRLVEFLIRIGAHTSYLALLSGSPKTMEILVSLFASSPYLAARLAGRPELLDSLVHSEQTATDTTGEQLDASLGEALSADPGDEEAILAALRRFRTAELVRIGLNDLSGTVEPDRVHHSLSLLAEVCLVRAVKLGHSLASGRFSGPWERVRLGVIAMGKMGAREMSYGSDLDLIFVYDSGRGGYDADAHVLATRWVHKTIGLLTTRTADGVAYEVDARLRPSGQSGPLVVSMERFAAYHDGEADLWERQALIRARVIYGDTELTTAIESAVSRTVYGQGLDDAGVTEIAGLRRRLEKELAKEGRGRTNIKTGRGGIVDIEFVVQMLQLSHGAEHPEVRERDTVEAIVGLRAIGALEAGHADKLREAYGFLRRLEARMRLERDRPVEELGTDAKALAPLAVRMGFSGADPGGELLAVYDETREEVRALYERYFAPPAL